MFGLSFSICLKLTKEQYLENQRLKKDVCKQINQKIKLIQMHAKWTGFKKYAYNNFSNDMLNGLDL